MAAAPRAPRAPRSPGRCQARAGSSEFVGLFLRGRSFGVLFCEGFLFLFFLVFFVCLGGEGAFGWLECIYLLGVLCGSDQGVRAQGFPGVRA